MELLDISSAAAESAFNANFNHHDISVLYGRALIDGVRTLFAGFDAKRKKEDDNYLASHLGFANQSLKFSFISSITAYTCFLWGYMGMTLWFIIAWGIGPFIVTDLMKLALAACILPAVWSLFKKA